MDNITAASRMQPLTEKRTGRFVQSAAARTMTCSSSTSVPDLGFPPLVELHTYELAKLPFPTRCFPTLVGKSGTQGRGGKVQHKINAFDL